MLFFDKSAIASCTVVIRRATHLSDCINITPTTVPTMYMAQAERLNWVLVALNMKYSPRSAIPKPPAHTPPRKKPRPVGIGKSLRPTATIDEKKARPARRPLDGSCYLARAGSDRLTTPVGVRRYGRKPMEFRRPVVLNGNESDSK